MSDQVTTALAHFRGQPVAEQVVSVSGLLAKRLASKSERTREAYDRDLRAFAEFVACELDEALQRLVASPPVVAEEIALEFQQHLIEQGYAASTVNRRIAALRSVLKLARAAGLTALRLEAVENLDAEEDARDVRGPGVAVVQQILRCCDADQSTRGVRDARILRWFIATALRRNELRQILLQDLRKTDDGWVAYVRAKGKRVRKHPVAIAQWLVDDLQAWLEVRGRAPGPLFGSLHRAHRGKMLGPSGLNQILRARAEEAGFPLGALEDQRKITPHALRHTSITEVIRTQGAAAAQAHARHKNAQTTQRYNDEKHQLARAGQDLLHSRLFGLPEDG